MCSFFSCKYEPWEVDGEIIIPSCILMERWGETNRPDNFLVPVYVIEMETRRSKCDFPNLPWFKCLLLAISRDFFPQEVNLRTCGENWKIYRSSIVLFKDSLRILDIVP